MKIGFMELVLVFVVALLVIGPDKLPAFAQKLGAALKEFRRASADVTKDVRENVIEPLEEAQKPIREAMEPLEQMQRDVRENIREVEREIQNIGKPAPAGTAKAAEATDAAEEARVDGAVEEARVDGAQTGDAQSARTDDSRVTQAPAEAERAQAQRGEGEAV